MATITLALLFGSSLSSCLILDDPYSEGTEGLLAPLISLLSPRYYLFLSDQPNAGNARSLLSYSPGGQVQLKTWNGGPGNILKGVVANGIIFAIDGSTNDTIWISRDQGDTWESWVNPSPESANLQRLVACNGTVIATYGSMAYSSGASFKGYFSTNSGASFTQFFVPNSATSSPGVTGLDCNDQFAFITVAYGNRLFRAAMSDLTSWSQPSNFGSASYPSSYQDPVASDDGLVVFAPITTLYMDHSTDQGLTPISSGQFPIGVIRLPGGADYGTDSYFLGFVDSSASPRCQVFVTTDGSNNPSGISPSSFDCGIAGDLGIPAVFADSGAVLAAYRYNSSANTGLAISQNRGSSFSNVDLTPVWNSSGYITSIARQ